VQEVFADQDGGQPGEVEGYSGVEADRGGRAAVGGGLDESIDGGGEGCGQGARVGVGDVGQVLGVESGYGGGGELGQG
jgi:hypothetical protein